MNRAAKILIFLLAITGLAPQTGQTCTTFVLEREGERVVGKNFDWLLEDGYVLVNKRGVRKAAMPAVPGSSGRRAEWTSTYGSLTFNQYGWENPFGGMNEAGLVVEIMMLTAGRYPGPDSRPYVKCLQWVQYQLDNYSTVQEVISSDRLLRIHDMEKPGLHYLVADSAGECAVIEFIDGKMVHYTGPNLPVKALTNSTYARSMNHLRGYEGFGGALPAPSGTRSLARFVRAAQKLRQNGGGGRESIVDAGFDVLNAVKQAGTTSRDTQWSIVYDQKNLMAYFRTFSQQDIKFVDLKKFDFSCDAPVIAVGINHDRPGDVTGLFKEFSLDMNRKLVRRLFNDTFFLHHLPDRTIDEWAEYPGTMICSPRK